MSEFYFDESAHRYYLDGEELPSVTRILRPLYDFSAIPPAVLQHAADRGTAIHKAIELYVDDDLDESSLCDEIKPYFAGFKKFCAEKNPTFVSSEAEIYHPAMKYAGKMDLLARMKDFYFVDVKTTAKLSAVARIQLLAYQEAALVCPLMSEFTKDIGGAKRAVLWLKRNGTYQLVQYKQEQYEGDLKRFTTLLNKVHSDSAVEKLVTEWNKLKEH